jgi:ABC-type Zn uptake system ZnuABC Zn-binding protein ZnuA
MDPTNAEIYRNNAAAYSVELQELDSWVHTEVNRVPDDRRQLVTDHDALGYFANRYGFEQVGTIVSSFSTDAAPSAQELAELEDAIRSLTVPAVFVGTTVNPALAEQVAADTGTRLVPLYTGSLSEAGGEADSYLNFMRYNVRAIVDALR